MFDYETAVFTLIERALGVPAGHGRMVLDQLTPSTAQPALEKVIDAWLATPEFAQTLDAAGITSADGRRNAAWSSLSSWLELAIIGREDLFPQSFTFMCDDRPTTDIVGDDDARIYTGILREVLGSGMIKLFYARDINRDINDLPSPEKLPFLYVWERKGEAIPYATVNAAAIDQILETRVARTHRHFRGVREWMVLRLEAYSKHFLGQAAKGGIHWHDFPAWPGPEQRTYIRQRADLRTRLLSKDWVPPELAA